MHLRPPTSSSTAPVLLLALLGAACAAGPGTTERVRPQEHAGVGRTLVMDFPDDTPGQSEHVDAYITLVRRAVVDAYDSLGFGVDTASHATVVATPYMRIQGRLFGETPNSSFLDCGRIGDGTPAADLHDDVQFRIYTVLAPSDAGDTEIETRIIGEAGPGGVRGRIACRGTGVLERRINRMALEQLPSR